MSHGVPRCFSGLPLRTKFGLKFVTAFPAAGGDASDNPKPYHFIRRFCEKQIHCTVITPIIVIKPVTGRLPLAYIELNECTRSRSTEMTKWVTGFTKREPAARCDIRVWKAEL